MIKHINKIAIEVLRDRFADYDWHSNHYDEEYKMIVKALGLAKNNESLHLVSNPFNASEFEYSEFIKGKGKEYNYVSNKIHYFVNGELIKILNQ